MDVLPRITHQLFELFRAMSLVQRVIFVVAALFLAGGFGWMSAVNQSQSLQAVAGGKSFSDEELSGIERTLAKAGLTQHRRDGRKLMAPASHLDRYNAAISDLDTAPSDFGSQMLRKFESLGPFATDRQRQEMKDALLLTELRQMIKEVPEVEDARVAIANPGRRASFGQKPRVTANITVKPKEDRPLPPQLIASLRQAVASMVPDLNAEDVTVFDVVSGRAVTGGLVEESSQADLSTRVRDISRHYEQQVQKGLAFIPKVGVAVHIDIEQLTARVMRSGVIDARDSAHQQANRSGSLRTNEPSSNATPHRTAFRGNAETDRNPMARLSADDINDDQLLAAVPSAIRASITVPRDYYRSVSIQRRNRGEKSAARLSHEEIEAEVLAKVERTVGRLIPSGVSHEAISVTSVDHTAGASPVESPRNNVRLLATFVEKNGTSVVMSLLAILAVWTLMRISMKKARPASVPATESRLDEERHASSSHSMPEPEVNHEPVVVPVASPSPAMMPSHRPESGSTSTPLHEEIRSLARSDPARAAAVLSQWLSGAA